MAATPALKAAVEDYLQHLKEHALHHDVPIEATLWQYLAAADTVELTVVSRRKAYIFALPAADFLDPHHAALYPEFPGLFLTAIKENRPLVSMWIPPHA